MIRVQLPLQAWRTWIYCGLLRLFILLELFMTSASLHDDVPPPMFLPGASNITVREGDIAVLPCAVKHLGTKQVAWRRIDADEFLTIGTMTWIGDENVAVDHSSKSPDITNWNLVIERVSPQHAGVYECQVTSKLGFNKLVKLNVVGPPISDSGSGLLPHLDEGDTVSESALFHGPVTRCGLTSPDGCLISITGKRYVDLGERIHLICNASGGSRIPEDIDWFKDGDMIDSDKYRHILIDKYQSIHDKAFISELMIDRAKLRDSGEYVCRSSRHNIVNVKVTVLRSQSPNKRRGTENPEGDDNNTASKPWFPRVNHLLIGILLLHAWAKWMTPFS